VLARLRAAGWRAVVEPVPYEFQRGGNEMLRAWPAGEGSST
jgi:hypothetical protein